MMSSSNLLAQIRQRNQPMVDAMEEGRRRRRSRQSASKHKVDTTNNQTNNRKSRSSRNSRSSSSSSSSDSASMFRSRDSLGSALGPSPPKGTYLVSRHFKRLLCTLMVEHGGTMSTDLVLEHVPVGTLHGVSEKEQMKIFKKTLKTIASIRQGLWTKKT